MQPTLRVTALDHIVLVCADVEVTLRWYTVMLGLAPVRVDEWRRGEAPFPSVRISPDTIIDMIPGIATDGRLDHLCIVVEPVDLDEVPARGSSRWSTVPTCATARAATARRCTSVTPTATWSNFATTAADASPAH